MREKEIPYKGCCLMGARGEEIKMGREGERDRKAGLKTTQ